MRILVLSGGGSRGAYQVGVLKRLVEAGKSWDLVAGISVGALNGSYLAMFDKADVAKGMEKLEGIWLGIKGTEDIVKPWLPSHLNHIAGYFKGSLKSSAPLLSLIESRFNHTALKSSDVDCRIGAVSLGRGQFRTIRKYEDNFLKWILASATMPVVMPPVEIEDDKWVDGGVREQTPINSVMDVIGNCLNRGEPIEIDLVLSGPTHNKVLAVHPTKITNLMLVALRCTQLAIEEIYLSNLGMLAEVKSINIYEPKLPLVVNSMEFLPEEIKAMIKIGYDETCTKFANRLQ